MISVSASMSLDVPAIIGRLHKDEITILRKHQKQMVSEIQKGHWPEGAGWKYKGRNPASVGRSRAGWKGRVQGTKYPYSLTIENKATGFYSKKPYVSFVKQSGHSEEEYLVVFKWLVFTRVPKLEQELAAAFLANVGTKRPMKEVNKSTAGPRSVGSTLT